MPAGVDDDAPEVIVDTERDEAAMKKWLMPAGVDDDAPVVIVDVEREVAVW